jgi:hypothetical protein
MIEFIEHNSSILEFEQQLKDATSSIYLLVSLVKSSNDNELIDLLNGR